MNIFVNIKFKDYIYIKFKDYIYVYMYISLKTPQGKENS